MKIYKYLYFGLIALILNAIIVAHAKADAWLIIPAGFYDRSQWLPTKVYHYAELEAKCKRYEDALNEMEKSDGHS